MNHEQLRSRLVRFARRHLGDRAGADDVAQETLRRVLEAATAGRIRDPGALAGFAHETARHIVQQHYRRRQREQRAFGKLESDEADPTSNPLDELISQQRRAGLLAALARLDPREQTLLVSLYEEGIALEAAAVRLGVKAGTLRVRKHRALQKLGTLLALPASAGT